MDNSPIASDTNESAPFFTVPFEMTDRTGLTEEIQTCLWLLYCVGCAAQHRHIDAYMDVPEHQKCVRCTAGKTVVMGIAESEDDDMEARVIPELDVQLRILRAVSERDGANVLNVVVVVARSPKAFSLGHALRASLMKQERDDRDVDDRRRGWNLVRNHVRFGLQDRGVVSGERAVTQGLGTDMDWLIGAGHFEYLFSTRVAIEWVSKRYFSRFPGESSMTIDGFGRFERGLTVIPDGHRELHTKRVAQVATAFSKATPKPLKRASHVPLKIPPPPVLRPFA